MLASVGRRVMELEEQGLFDHVGSSYDLAPSGCEHSGVFRVSHLPKSHRLHELEVVLTGDPVRLVTLRFERERDFDRAKMTICI